MINTYKWFSLLSARQRSEMIAIVLIMVIILGAGIVMNLHNEQISSEIFTTDMSIQDIAPQVVVTGKALARELKLNLDVPKKKPLKELGITNANLEHTIKHLLSHKHTSIKYYIFTALVFGAVAFLIRLGRPDGIDIKQKQIWFPRVPYISFLLLSIILCGFVLGKSPNPMEGIVKVFKSMVGLYPDPSLKVLACGFFIVLAIIGNKAICGWACPFGALQEIIYSLPILRKIKQRKLPFILTNTIRTLLFLIMLLFLFSIIGERKGFVIYHYINPFNLFNFDFDSISVLITVISVLMIAFISYRPFCQFICPFGLASWIAERFSLCRVIINKDKCTECGACIKACPLDAAKGRVESKTFPADCFSCARCLNVCPVDAINYCPVWAKGKDKITKRK